jgi:hypothetical protein
MQSTTTDQVTAEQVQDWSDHPIVKLAFTRAGGKQAPVLEVFEQLEELLEHIEGVSFASALAAAEAYQHSADLWRGTGATAPVTHVASIMCFEAGLDPATTARMFDLDVVHVEERFAEHGTYAPAVASLHEGLSYGRAAKLHGVSPYVLKHHAERCGFDRSIFPVKYEQRLAFDWTAELSAVAAGTETMTEAVARLKVNWTTLRKHMKRLAIEPGKKRTYVDKRDGSGAANNPAAPVHDGQR